MTRMTGPDCTDMCNLIHTHTLTHTCQCEWHIITLNRMTGPGCALITCNIINTLVPRCWEDLCEWHRMTGMTGPDFAVMYNLINIYSIHTHKYH